MPVPSASYVKVLRSKTTIPTRGPRRAPTSDEEEKIEEPSARALGSVEFSARVTGEEVAPIVEEPEPTARALGSVAFTERIVEGFAEAEAERERLAAAEAFFGRAAEVGKEYIEAIGELPSTAYEKAVEIVEPIEPLEKAYDVARTYLPFGKGLPEDLPTREEYEQKRLEGEDRSLVERAKAFAGSFFPVSPGIVEAAGGPKQFALEVGLLAGGGALAGPGGPFARRLGVGGIKKLIQWGGASVATTGAAATIAGAVTEPTTEREAAAFAAAVEDAPTPREVEAAGEALAVEQAEVAALETQVKSLGGDYAAAVADAEAAATRLAVWDKYMTDEGLNVSDTQFAQYQKDYKAWENASGRAAGIEDKYVALYGKYDVAFKEQEQVYSQYAGIFGSLEDAQAEVSGYLDPATGQIDIQSMFGELGETQATILLAQAGYKPTIDKGIWQRLPKDIQGHYTPTEHVGLEHQAGIAGAYGRGVERLFEPHVEWLQKQGVLGQLGAGMYQYMVPHTLATGLFPTKGKAALATLVPHFGPTAAYTALTWEQQPWYGKAAGIGFAAMPFVAGPLGGLAKGVGSKLYSRFPSLVTATAPFRFAAGVAAEPLKALHLEAWAPWRFAYKTSGLAGQAGLAKVPKLGPAGAKWGWWEPTPAMRLARAAEIAEGRPTAATPKEQVLVKDPVTGRYRWQDLEVPPGYEIDPATGVSVPKGYKIDLATGALVSKRGYVPRPGEEIYGLGVGEGAPPGGIPVGFMKGISRITGEALPTRSWFQRGLGYEPGMAPSSALVQQVQISPFYVQFTQFMKRAAPAAVIAAPTILGGAMPMFGETFMPVGVVQVQQDLTVADQMLAQNLITQTQHQQITQQIQQAEQQQVTPIQYRQQVQEVVEQTLTQEQQRQYQTVQQEQIQQQEQVQQQLQVEQQLQAATQIEQVVQQDPLQQQFERQQEYYQQQVQQQVQQPFQPQLQVAQQQLEIPSMAPPIIPFPFGLGAPRLGWGGVGGLGRLFKPSSWIEGIKGYPVYGPHPWSGEVVGRRVGKGHPLWTRPGVKPKGGKGVTYSVVGSGGFGSEGRRGKVVRAQQPTSLRMNI